MVQYGCAYEGSQDGNTKSVPTQLEKLQKHLLARCNHSTTAEDMVLVVAVYRFFFWLQAVIDYSTSSSAGYASYYQIPRVQKKAPSKCSATYKEPNGTYKAPTAYTKFLSNSLLRSLTPVCHQPSLDPLLASSCQDSPVRLAMC